MNTQARQQLIGCLWLSLAAAIWGGVYVVSKVVLDYIPPFTLLIIRFTISLLILGAIVVARKEYVKKQDLPLMMLVGFIGVTISIAAQFLGTKLSNAHMGAIITSASPAFIAVFAVWLLKERLGVHQIIGITLATAGVLVVVGLPDASAESSSFLGNIILLIAAVSWGLYTVLCKRATQTYSSLAVTAYVSFFGVLFSSPLMIWELATTPIDWSFGWPIWAGVLYVGVISTTVAFYLWNKGFEMVQAGSGAVFFFFQPIVGTLFGWLLLGEHLSVGFFIGALCILAGVGFSNRQTVKK